LLLGTLPGAVSLGSGQYYAQPSNAFWRIMDAVAGASPELPYTQRIQRLADRRIALWDVCAAAERSGSTDVAIRRDTVQPNDFVSFFRTHPAIELICFNGATPWDLYRRHVLPSLDISPRGIRHVVLPSTSNAYAAMSFEAKLAAWRKALAHRDNP
jgi:TDG/mug DNA glycosylase family protein